MDPLYGCHPTSSSVPGPRSPVPWVDSLQVATGAAPVSTRLGNNPRELALQRGVFGEKKLRVGGRHGVGGRGVRGSEGISPAPGVTSQNESSPGAGRVRAPSASSQPLWRGVPPGPHHARSPPRTCPESQSVPSRRGVRQNGLWEPQTASVYLQTQAEPLAAVPGAEDGLQGLRRE